MPIELARSMERRRPVGSGWGRLALASRDASAPVRAHVALPEIALLASESSRGRLGMTPPVHQRHPGIGQWTVYRSVGIFADMYPQARESYPGAPPEFSRYSPTNRKSPGVHVADTGAKQALAMGRPG